MTPTHTASEVVTNTFEDGKRVTTVDLDAALGVEEPAGSHEFVVYVTNKDPYALESDWCRHSVLETDRGLAVKTALNECHLLATAPQPNERIHVEVYPHTGTHLQFEHRLVEV